jgi:hypothetical protein
MKRPKRMNKIELFDFMIDTICLYDNSENLTKLKTMCFGDFGLDFKEETWVNLCKRNCYKKHLDLFSYVHRMITYNHSHPLQVWVEFTTMLNEIKYKNQ